MALIAGDVDFFLITVDCSLSQAFVLKLLEESETGFPFEHFCEAGLHTSFIVNRIRLFDPESDQWVCS